MSSALACFPSLTAESQRFLQNAAVVSTDEDSEGELSHEVVSFLAERDVSSEKEFREEVLSLCGDSTEGRKEQAFQLLALGRDEEALPIVEGLLPEFFKEGNIQATIDLSDRIISQLSLDSIELRASLMFWTGDFAKDEPEIRRRLKATEDTKERIRLSFMLARILRNRAEWLESIEKHEYVLKHTLDHELLHIRSLREKAAILDRRDPKLALKLVEEAHRLAMEHFPEDDHLMGDIYNTIGLVKAEFMDRSALDAHRKALELFRRAGLRVQEGVSLANIIDLENEWLGAKESFPKWEELKKFATKYSIGKVIHMANQNLVFQLRRTGKYRRADEVLAKWRRK